jgi:hypothetical protein
LQQSANDISAHGVQASVYGQWLIAYSGKAEL